MDSHNHISEVLDLIFSLMSRIGLILCHPKDKFLLYHRFILSKVSLGKAWVTENFDNLVSCYVR